MSLSNLIKLQQQAKGLTTHATPTTPGPSDAVAVVPESVSPGQIAAPVSAKPAAVGGLRLGGLRLGGANSLHPKPSTPAKGPVDSGPEASAPSVAAAEPADNDSAVFGLADLAGFDASDAPEVRPGGRVSSSFGDEILATAPERPVDPDLTPQMLDFIQSLDNIYPVLHDSDMFAQAIRVVMMELQDNPEYKKLVSDHDIHTMIRAMRNTMGMAKIKKQEKSRKTGTGTRKNAKATSTADDATLALLDSVMGEGWDD